MESFGGYLRQERELRGISLEEISRETKVSLRHLEALEADRHQQLPAKPFVKGFLDAYSKYLGLNPDEVYLRYQQVLLEGLQCLEEEGETPFYKLSRPSVEKSSWRNWTIPIGLVIIVGLFFTARWFLDHRERNRLEGSEVPAYDQGQEAGAGMPLSEPPPPTPSAQLSSPTSGPVGIRLIVRAEETTWLSAVADGGEEEEWTMNEGEYRELTAEKRLVLSLGNAGGVRLTFNGRELGYIGEKGEVKRELLFVSEAK